MRCPDTGAVHLRGAELRCAEGLRWGIPPASTTPDVRVSVPDASKTPKHPIGPNPCLLHTTDLLQKSNFLYLWPRLFRPTSSVPVGLHSWGRTASARGAQRAAHQLPPLRNLFVDSRLCEEKTDNQPAVASARAENKTSRPVFVFRSSSC